MRIHILLQGFLAILTIAGAEAQQKRAISNYKNAKLSAEVRVQDLLSRMTLGKK